MSEAAVKKYVVRLSAEERQTLEALISKGKHPAAQVLKARILLKADVSEAGEGWSDSRIVKALDVSPATIYRTRQRLVEEGFEAVLARKHSPNSARPRIFDGAAEAKLIALMCSPPPKGRAKWTLRLLEDTVVELNIVERASDNTIGRTLKKTISVRQAKLAWSSRWKSGEGKAVARRPVASVAWTSVTAVAKRTQQSCGVGY
jgi:transposase